MMFQTNQKPTEQPAYLFKTWRLASLALALFLASCQTTPSSTSIPSSSGRDTLGHRPGPRGFTTVIIDAGHGGKDSGENARSTGLVEKTLALDTARRLRSELGGSFRVVMMRDSDTFVDLDERVRIANSYGNGILVSIHYNASAPRIAGPETYFWRVDSYTLAKRVQRNLSAVCAYHNSRGLVRRRLRLTRNPEIPCILVECGYLTSPGEARLISDSSYRAKLARAIANAVREQATVGDGDLGPLPNPINSPLSRPGDSRQ